MLVNVLKRVTAHLLEKFMSKGSGDRLDFKVLQGGTTKVRSKKKDLFPNEPSGDVWVVGEG